MGSHNWYRRDISSNKYAKIYSMESTCENKLRMGQNRMALGMISHLYVIFGTILLALVVAMVVLLIEQYEYSSNCNRYWGLKNVDIVA
jgi:hypothetical protein